MSFEHALTVRLYDTDAAGYIFFGSQFRMAHEAFEAFIEHLGLSIGETLRDGRYLCPLVHAEADYLVPLAVGDRVAVRVAVRNIGQTSFTVAYRLYTSAGAVLAGTVGTVHVVVDRGSRKAIPIPDDLRRHLASALEPDPAA
jgi:1,4-dihydroxy-2-naphthoyl-CoA hydrolase